MFSGIVEGLGEVVSLSRGAGGTRFVVDTRLELDGTELGDSIAIEGVCLTVVERTGSVCAFDVADETLRRSTLGSLDTGSRVNVERSLRVGSRIHGHFVFGHVDTTVVLAGRIPEGTSERLEWTVESRYLRYIAEKGSVSLAGVSLTVGSVGDAVFSVYVVPHTASRTSLGSVRIGQSVNLEVDMLARYVETLTRVS